MIEQKINLRFALTATKPVWLTTLQWMQVLGVLIGLLIAVNGWRYVHCVYLEKQIILLEQKQEKLSGALNTLVDQMPTLDSKVTVAEAIKQLTNAVENRKVLENFLAESKAGESKLSEICLALASISTPVVSLQSIILNHRKHQLILLGQGDSQASVTRYLQQLQRHKVLNTYHFKTVVVTDPLRKSQPDADSDKRVNFVADTDAGSAHENLQDVMEVGDASES
jgi:hypothetical protein